ncbi:O-antigen polymerase [Bifidobacterium pseudocatenulatum]|uniref:O-antigen polymerase n=1 Tax=Bifidobacterium pseudocatenulatum TaxID=28026 RepID=UPI0034A45AEC
MDYFAHKDISSPVIVFTSLWLFICTLASLRLYGFTGYSEKTIGYITCGSVAFSLGAFSSTLVNKQTTKQTRYAHLRGKNLQTSDGNQQQLCFTFLEIILALACVGSALSLFYSLNAFRSGASYMEVRGSRLGYNDEQAFSNPIVGLFVTYFCGPAMTVLIPIAIVFLFKKQHKKFSLIVFLCALADVISSGGRIQIIYIVSQLIAAFFYYRKTISSKTKKIIKNATIVGIVMLFVLTSLRTSQNFLQAIYAYFTLPVGLFSYYTSIVDVNNFESFGAATFYPLFYVLASVISFFGAKTSFLDNLIHYVGLPQETWTSTLFPTGSYNAFCSLFYFFYLDFRIIGIVLFSLLYGFISGYVYKKQRTRTNDTWFIFYLLILRTIVGSFMIFQLGNTKFFVSLFIFGIAILLGKKEIKEES